MHINFNTYNIHFKGQSSKSYNLGFNHGRNDGLIGSRTIQKDKNIEINKQEYEKGYNKGYNVGKAGRMSETVTVTDVIQDLINSGTPREQAIKFAAQYLGGW